LFSCESVKENEKLVKPMEFSEPELEILELIRAGSGFEEVAKYGLYQEGGLLGETNDSRLGIEGYYFSGSDVSILLTLEMEMEPKTNYYITNIEFLNENFEPFGERSNRNIFFDHTTNPPKAEIEITRGEHLPNVINLKFDVESNKNLATSVTGGESIIVDETDIIFRGLDFQLVKHVADIEDVYKINRTISQNGLSVDIHDMTIRQTTLDLTMDILSDDLIFYDFASINVVSTDKLYPVISDGVYRKADEGASITYYFESPYFDEGDNLELVIDGIYAIEEGNHYIEVDLESKMLVKQIDDQIEIVDIHETDQNYNITFKVTKGVSFKSYDDHPFNMICRHDVLVITEKQGIVIEKSLIDDSIVKIDFSYYPYLKSFKKKIQLKK
jgi:hypothetical protein